MWEAIVEPRSLIDLIEMLSLPVELVPLDFHIISKVCSKLIGLKVHVLVLEGIKKVRKSRAENLGGVKLFLIF